MNGLPEGLAELARSNIYVLSDKGRPFKGAPEAVLVAKVLGEESPDGPAYVVGPGNLQGSPEGVLKYQFTPTAQAEFYGCYNQRDSGVLEIIVAGPDGAGGELLVSFAIHREAATMPELPYTAVLSETYHSNRADIQG
ncbi:MAG: hypothetical protein HY544_00980 [Candidatus Diapherotrites archaeon]|uniref:Uncharacterized protein n=1 Tax=Candidatus Iainarchaeum sp. TaxID=3101447 RepID=A0A8T3YL79_9ARCH|nr:hypothetical protein [Candidatus Diapherotrites archaeon]